MSETRQPDSSRLHIPIEIFFRVLNFVPIDHILQFRTLCRAARDEIDTRMLYSYIRRTKLPSCPSRSAVEHAALEYNNLLALLRGTATFSHLAPNSSPSISSPIWAGTHAVFQFDAGWISAYREMCALATLFSSQTMDAIKGDFRKPFSPHYTPVWYAQLDNAVLDLDVRWWPGDPLQTFDLYNGTLSIPWRRMLKSFLVAETKISFMVAQHTDKGTPSFTFSLEEDCIRAVRRERFRRALKTEHPDIRQIDNMRSLFAGNHAASIPRYLDYIEDYFMKLVRSLRAFAMRNEEPL